MAEGALDGPPVATYLMLAMRDQVLKKAAPDATPRALEGSPKWP
jgi:hypothetical protein